MKYNILLSRERPGAPSLPGVLIFWPILTGVLQPPSFRNEIQRSGPPIPLRVLLVNIIKDSSLATTGSKSNSLSELKDSFSGARYFPPWFMDTYISASVPFDAVKYKLPEVAKDG